MGDNKVKMSKEFFVKQDNPKSTQKKKCGGKKCEKPECNQQTTEAQVQTIVHPYHDRELRAKCLELALKTTRLEEDAIKWARRYWRWVEVGD